MKQYFLSRWASILLLALLMNACQQVLYVAPRKVDCTMGIDACHLIKKDLEDNWILQSDPLIGLNYVEGFRYKVKAKRVRSDLEEAASGYQLNVMEIMETTQVFENAQLLGGKVWLLTGFGPEAALAEPVGGTEIRVEFNTEERKINGAAGCNRFFGKYEATENALSVSSLGSTKMACDSGVMDQESEFLKLLQNTSRYTVDERTLQLSDQSGNILVFELAMN